MDISKYKKVASGGGRCGNETDAYINKLLSEGWQIISIKIIEAQYRVHSSHGQEDYIRKSEELCFVLGRTD